MSFPDALKFTLRWEGGEVNDPDDPGGRTKYGISQRAYPNVDIGALTQADAAAIYKRDYWDRAGCDDLEEPLARIVFDYAVNSGVRRARKALADTVDERTPRGQALAICQARGYLFVRLAVKRPGNERFLNGWMRRLQKLIAYAKRF